MTRPGAVGVAPGVTLGYTPLAVPFAFVHRLRSGAQGVVERLADVCGPD